MQKASKTSPSLCRCMMRIAVAVTRDKVIYCTHTSKLVFLNTKEFDWSDFRHLRFSAQKGKIPTWPFLVLSCFGGTYALRPYSVLWRPPPPPIEEAKLRRWPLNFLESKFTAGVRSCFTLTNCSLPCENMKKNNILKLGSD